MCIRDSIRSMPLIHHSRVTDILNHPDVCKVLNTKEWRGDRRYKYILHIEDNGQLKLKKKTRYYRDKYKTVTRNWIFN